MGRKAFGPSKKQSCDLHHCKKKKKTSSYKVQEISGVVKHQRVHAPVV